MSGGAAPEPVRLGEVTAPSGALVLVDAGMLGEPWDEVAQFAVEVPGIPASGRFVVRADPLPPEEGVVCWAQVVVEVRPGEKVVRSEPVGQVAVDWARILVIDRDARRAWRHEDALDGLADVAFWGLEGPRLAADVGAPEFADEEGVFGWKDLPLAEAERRAAATDARREALGLRVPIDFRVHSDHWRGLEGMRATDGTTDSASYDVGGARVCLFGTRVGDGQFPVLVDRGADGGVVAVRVEFCE